MFNVLFILETVHEVTKNYGSTDLSEGSVNEGVRNEVNA